MAARPQGSWLLAWLAGAGVPFIAGTVACTAWTAWLSARDGARWDASQWLGALPAVMMVVAVIAIPTALLGIGLTVNAERRMRRSLPFWLMLGAVATTPAVLAILGFTATDPFEREEISLASYVMPPLEFYAAGLIGALAAWRVRRGSWSA